MAEVKKPTAEAIRRQLDRILQSPDFKGSDKQRHFLSFVVNETLSGRVSQIKGYTIALTVYGRSEGFDPQSDPVVRLEAGRLRRKLEGYYVAAGKSDPVYIDIPKGGYVPTFEKKAPRSYKPTKPSAGPDAHGLSKEPSIAVLPLLNLTGDHDQDYFMDGMTEELTSELARYQEFQVIASQSALQYKGKQFDLKKIGNELGVRFLVTGSVRKGIDDIKVTVQLVDANTTEHIWSESYKRVLQAADLIELQEEIAHRVVGTIADHYGSITRRLCREAGKMTPSTLMAYDAVLRFYHYETVLTTEAFETALSALEKAIELDPEYGLAWSMLGHLHADNYALGFCEMETPLEKAFEYAKKGVMVAPENQFAHDALSLVYFHRGDKEQFLEHVQETISLNPNAPYIAGVAGWHMALFGEWERGLDLLNKGIKLNPHHPTWFHLVPYMDYYRQSEYKKALSEAMKFNFPNLYLDPMMRAAALGQMGRKDEAEKALKELTRLAPDFIAQGRERVGRYVKVDSLIEHIFKGLLKAGLDKIS